MAPRPLCGLLLVAAAAVCLSAPEPVAALETLGTRFAYVTFLYGDEKPTISSNAFPGTNLLATRSAYKLVVAVGKGVTPAVKVLLAFEGAVVADMPELQHPNVLGQDPAVVHLRNRLLLWNMTAYDRVLYVEAAHHILNNVDHLFHCGNLCAVPWAFVQPSSLWVVTPGDAPTYSLVERGLRWPLHSPLAPSRGLILLVQEALEAAPLFFDYTASPKDSPPAIAVSGNPAAPPQLRRLITCYNMPYLYYVERMNWNLLRCGPLANHDVPAYLVSFSNSPVIAGVNWEVWFWFTGRFIPVRTSWNNMRHDTRNARDVAQLAVRAAQATCHSRDGRPPLGLQPSVTCDTLMSLTPDVVEDTVSDHDRSPALAPLILLCLGYAASEMLLRQVPSRTAAVWEERVSSAYVVFRHNPLTRYLLFASVLALCTYHGMVYVPRVADPAESWFPFIVVFFSSAVMQMRLLAVLAGTPPPSMVQMMPFGASLAALVVFWGIMQNRVLPVLGDLHLPVLFAAAIYLLSVVCAGLVACLPLLARLRGVLVETTSRLESEVHSHSD